MSNTSKKLAIELESIIAEEINHLIEERNYTANKILTFLEKIDNIEGIIDPRFKEYLKDIYRSHFNIKFIYI